MSEEVGAGWTRETRIRRDRFGRWFDGDEPIEHPRITDAFNRWIDRAPDGRYILKNATHWAYVAIEGPPIWVLRARVEGEALLLTLSDGRAEPLDPGTLSQDAAGQLSARVRGGTMPAGFTNAAGADLMELLEEGEDGRIELVWSGRRYLISVVDPPAG